MEERKQHLLGLIVEHYIATAQPIGSQFLSGEGGLDVSAATIRNEMRELELDGFLVQPHTSAGRIPSQKGYRFYVDHILKPKKLSKKIEEEFDGLIKGEADAQTTLKHLAKNISEKAENAVIVAFSRDSLYYTGIGSLFSQPEFQNYQYTIHISSLFDRCEQVVDRVYELTSDTTTVLIGEENPFGSICSLAGVKLSNGGLLCVLGPMRMEYGRVIPMLQYIQQLGL